MAGTVRTAKKLMLGREIAHMMSIAGVTQQQVALILETSPSRVAILLNGGGAIAVGDLERLANRLGFTEAGYLTALNELRRDNHKRGFWTTGYNRAYSEDIRLRIDIERHADQIRATHTEVVPGLLQTENYIRAMYADQPSDIEGLTSEEAVQARLARQEILDKSDPPQLHIILSESCIRRMWAPDDVMREQIQHLIKLSKRPRIMLQLLPYRMPPGSRAPIGTRFTLLRAPSPGVAGPLELCYIEGEGEIRYLDEKKTLIAYDTAWTRLTAAALGFAESRKFLTRVLDETP
jgi:transcriptional regulator with XRE-family HTH domain